MEKSKITVRLLPQVARRLEGYCEQFCLRRDAFLCRALPQVPVTCLYIPSIDIKDDGYITVSLNLDIDVIQTVLTRGRTCSRDDYINAAILKITGAPPEHWLR